MSKTTISERVEGLSEELKVCGLRYEVWHHPPTGEMKVVVSNKDIAKLVEFMELLAKKYRSTYCKYNPEEYKFSIFFRS